MAKGGTEADDPSAGVRTRVAAGRAKPGTPIVAIPTEQGRSSHAAVARTLALDIVAGRLPAGGRLAGDAVLIDRFGVSRPVLREAVKTLAAKGMLVSKTRVGTVVRARSDWNMFDPDLLAWHLDAGVDSAFLRDLADIRLAVEPHAAALAAARRDDAALAAMRDAVARMDRAAFSSDAFAEADLSLHLAIAVASNNRFMRSVGAVIEAALRASFLLSAPVDETGRRGTVSAHRDIVDAIERGDPTGASAAMTEVIHNGLRRHGALAPRDAAEQAWMDGVPFASLPPEPAA